MTRAGPGRGEFAKLVALGDQDEVPRLPVLRGRRPAPGLEYLIQVRRRNRAVGEGPHVTAGCDGLPGLHDGPNARGAAYILGSPGQRRVPRDASSGAARV